MGIYIVAYLLAGYEVLWQMLKGIGRGDLFDENFLMGIASLGAFLIGERAEAVAVLIFYGVGELFQNMAVAKSRGNIAKLMDIRPDYANILIDGVVTTVAPDKVPVGSIITVKPGEKIPLDGVVVRGNANIDTSALTGESMPREVEEGNQVLSGSINLSGLLEVRTTAAFSESTVSKILELVENASSKKAESEKFITKFAKVYTPAVVGVAVLVAVVPPLLGWGPFNEWLYKALSFLIISCPCALVLSIPMSFFGGIGGGARHGVLVKGGNYLEALNLVDTIVFDKTGTLTMGKFAVSGIHTTGGSEEELVRLGAICEKHSNHPIAQSVMAYYQGEEVPDYALEEIGGMGIKAEKEGHTLLAGNGKLMEKFGITYEKSPAAGTVIHIAENGNYKGYITIADQMKPEAAEAIQSLKAMGVKNVVMLTGDREEVAKDISQKLGITDYRASLLPQDKVSALEGILEQAKGKSIFVGDGINDAPVLARADIGIAMGGIGSDAAIEAADVVIMNDDLRKLPLGLRISRKTRSIVVQNIVFALGVKLAIMLLTLFGITSIWFAIFADVGVALIAILNAMRALYIQE